jgi:hypothetical protein
VELLLVLPIVLLLLLFRRRSVPGPEDIPLPGTQVEIRDPLNSAAKVIAGLMVVAAALLAFAGGALALAFGQWIAGPVAFAIGGLLLWGVWSANS